MKQIKTFKILGTLFIVFGFLFTSCTKEGPTGPVGATGAAGPDAKTFDFSLSYSVGDSLKTTTLTGSDATDVAITYWRFSDSSMLQLPYGSYENSAFVIPYFYPSTGHLDIEIPIRVGTGITLTFRSVLIKSSAKVPFLDYSNYSAVKNYYHLAD
jgi:hypothetical protein